MFTRIREVNDCKNGDFVTGADQPEPGAQRFASRMDGALASGGNGVQEGGTDGAPSAPPAISLPKGGGAIRGMGKKFVANPVTGSMNVPRYASQGHSGSGPQFSLSYNFGTGNGPFGFGCGLSVSEIPARRTRGCPSTGKASQPGGEDLLRQALVSEASRNISRRRASGGDYYGAVGEILFWRKLRKDPGLDPQAPDSAAIAAPHGWIKGCLIGREKNPTGGVINVRPKAQRGKENA